LHQIPDWNEELECVRELHRALTKLSKNQRVVILHAYRNTDTKKLGRLTISTQTLQEKLNLDPSQMWNYYNAIEQTTGLMDLDGMDQTFQLCWKLKVSGSDAFGLLKDFLKDDEDQRLFVDCDFTILD